MCLCPRDRTGGNFHQIPVVFRLRQPAEVKSFFPWKWGRKVLGAFICFEKKKRKKQHHPVSGC